MGVSELHSSVEDLVASDTGTQVLGDVTNTILEATLNENMK